MKLVRLTAAVIGLAVVLFAAWRLTLRSGPPGGSYPIPGTRLSYTVEVLNGTDVDGLARTITARLRHAGIDVVSYGMASDTGRDSTLLLVRSADTAAAWAVREALGFGKVDVEPDPRLLLDVSVVLGKDAVR